jgi:hypothetical protein
VGGGLPERRAVRGAPAALVLHFRDARAWPSCWLCGGRGWCRQQHRCPCAQVRGGVQVYIKSEEKHAERVAVRARCMAMDPARNKYVRNMHNIRAIQEHLVRSADKAGVPKINNSNVDVSVTTIHTTILAVLRRCGLSSCCHSMQV